MVGTALFMRAEKDRTVTDGIASMRDNRATGALTNPDGSDPRVLLVDDVEEIVEEVCTIFRLRGVPAVGAGNLAEAIAMLERFGSLVLVASDIRLGDEEGADIVRLVSTHPAFAHRRIDFVFMTGDVMRFAEGATIAGYPLLLKPVHPDRLLETSFALMSARENVS
jgi:CheY-like chemotaxis protein